MTANGGMKKNINFEVQLEGSAGWSAKFEWLGNEKIGVGVFYKGRHQHSGTMNLKDFRSMMDAFDALDAAENAPARLPILMAGDPHG